MRMVPVEIRKQIAKGISDEISTAVIDTASKTQKYFTNG